MKKIFTLILVVSMSFMILACQESAEEVSMAGDFYAEKQFEAAGFTPAYTYIIAGSLDEDGKVTAIHFDMISSRGVSKRSTDYLMNIAHVSVGGEVGHQTLDIFIGGSTQNIPQVYNYIRGTLSNPDALFKDFSLFGMMGPYTGDQGDEIFNLLAEALEINITASTKVWEVMDALGLWDEENEIFKNTGTGPNRKTLELTGRWGGGSFDNQLVALETYIIENGLTLEEVYTLLTEVNQADDVDRDTVAGATMMFEPKIASTLALIIEE